MEMERITKDNEKIDKIKSLKVGEHVYFSENGHLNEIINSWSCFKYNFQKITEEEAKQYNLQKKEEGRDFNLFVKLK